MREERRFSDDGDNPRLGCLLLVLAALVFFGGLYLLASWVI